MNARKAHGRKVLLWLRFRYAVKDTDRRRMLGAVVGKAMEPLHKGNGVIQVLVTLQ